MLEFLTLSDAGDDAIAIIKNDHKKVKDLFEKFEKTDDLRQKKKIAAEAIMELKIHAEIEEKIFYPSVRSGLKKDVMNEADEEHHVAKLLIGELDQMDGSEDHWEAKFTVLAENIRHHIREEESDMLPQARKLNKDFDAIGQKLLAMKQQLKKNGVPATAEAKLMARNAPADSPAQAAKKKPTLKTKPMPNVKKTARKANGSASAKGLRLAKSKKSNPAGKKTNAAAQRSGSRPASAKRRKG